jgi:hypothetical protein
MNRQKTLLPRSALAAPFVLAALLTLAATAPTRAQTLVQSFTLTEHFGVSHPDQIVEFALGTSIDPNNSFVVGPGGQEVPYQLLSSGRIAIRTDLPANTTRTWQLMSGRAPQAIANGVTVTTGSGYYEIVNGITGVRVWRPEGQTRTVPIQRLTVSNGVALVTCPVDHELETGVSNNPDFATARLQVTLGGLTTYSAQNGSSFTVQEAINISRPDTRVLKLIGFIGANGSDSSGTLTVPETRTAPIQGILLRDGRWSGTADRVRKVSNSSFWDGRVMNANRVTASVLENGPLKVSVRVAYEYDRPRLLDNTGAYLELIPAGSGSYRCTVTLLAGQPSVLIDDDTDMDLRWFLNFYQTVQPDQGRYRGHHSTSIANGYEADGRQYRPVHERPPMDAFRDFTFTGTVNLPVAGWNPWIADSGWYWMVYNKAAALNAPVLGMYCVRAGDWRGGDNSYVGLYQSPNDGTGQKTLGFWLQAQRGVYTSTVDSRCRLLWAIFIGTKGDDLGNPYTYQNIARQMNLHGLMDLTRLNSYVLTFADPPQGYGRLFMEPEILQRMIAKLQDEVRRGLNQYSGPYYSYLFNAEPYARSLIDMWADPTGAKARIVLTNATAVARSYLDAVVNKDGIYEFDYAYWTGGLKASGQMPLLDGLLVRSDLSAAERTQVKAAASLFANLLWNNDYVPLDNWQSNRVNLGTANMPIQFREYRNEYGLFLSEHPTMVPRKSTIRDDIVAALRSSVSEDGAAIGSPHYTGASAGATLIGLLQLRMSGQDEFAREPRLSRLAEFYMQLLTPPEVRFGGSRKMFAAGDGSTEGTEFTGLLATGFRTASPSLSSRLMGAWKQGGKRHSGFFASTLMMIDEEAPASDPQLRDGNFSGYMSVFRHGWGSPNETALWLLNGDFYSDHRHYDHGSLSLYALEAPVSLSWGSMYYPQAGGANMKSMVVPLANFATWNQNNQAVTISPGWTSSTSDRFASFTNSAFANARMTNGDSGLIWTRTAHSIHPNESLPVIYIRDDFAGVNPTQAKVVTFNLMADGAVSTPGGAITPPKRTYDYGGALQEMPSASSTFNLPVGLNRLGFVGQTWNAHPTRGVDWDLYTLSSETLSANIGNWAHTWHPGTEENEYRTANGVSFEERQHILRVKGNGSFRTFILPWRKGEKPAGLQVTGSGTQLSIRNGNQLTIIDDNYYVYTNMQKRLLTTFSTNPASAFGFTVSGGPTELVLENNRAYITSHGGRARRILNCPPDWTVARLAGQTLPATVPLNPLNIDYSSDQPQTVILE